MCSVTKRLSIRDFLISLICNKPIMYFPLKEWIKQTFFTEPVWQEAALRKPESLTIKLTICLNIFENVTKKHNFQKYQDSNNCKKLWQQWQVPHVSKLWEKNQHFYNFKNCNNCHNCHNLHKRQSAQLPQPLQSSKVKTFTTVTTVSTVNSVKKEMPKLP